MLEPWQRRLLRRLFGWKRPDNTRRYRKLYCSVPRKNGKSTLLAGIVLYLTGADNEDGADVYCVANDKEQARIIFKEARKMVEASAELKKEFEAFSTAIIYPETSSALMPLSSEKGNKDGLNPHAVAADELHEWEDRDLWEKLSTAMASRRQPLFLVITTAGYELDSIWGEEDTYAHQVAAGELEDVELLVVIYEAPADADWHDPKVWAAANPGWGVSVKPDYIGTQHEKAKMQPSFAPAFRRYHLNQRVQQAVTWMPMRRWDACGKGFDLDRLVGMPCYIGVDLARRYDLTAAVAVFRIQPEGAEHAEYCLLPKFFIPAETKEGEGLESREHVDKVPYRQWRDKGFLTVTPGNVTDYDFVTREILEWAKIYDVREIPHDPYNAGQLAIDLAGEGLTPVEFRQNIVSMSPPTKELLNLTLQKRIRHGGHPILRWNAQNATAVRDANDNEKLLKHKSRGRIDGIIAAIMGLARAMVQENGVSIYEDGGIKVL